MPERCEQMGWHMPCSDDLPGSMLILTEHGPNWPDTWTGGYRAPKELVARIEAHRAHPVPDCRCFACAPKAATA